MNTDYINNWHRIWSNRVLQETSENNVLQQLISIDGFDSPLGLMSEGDWKEYVTLFATRSGIVNGDSIFEVGCGAGAFLYPFYKTGFKIGGIDYSRDLIQIAQTVMPEKKSVLNENEACFCPIDPKVDVVIANHVIHYFPSIEYSNTVLELMLQKSRRVVSISAIPDLNLKDESENERRGLLSSEEYEQKYKGLNILYYQREWFEKLASKHGYSIHFYDHEMPGFAQNRFRFDCVMTRV